MFLLILIGCSGPNASQPNTAPGLTFNQRFTADELCFDDDGADEGEATGCATKPWIQLDVVDGAVEDGSEIGLTGGDDFFVKGIFYGPSNKRVEPVVGNFTWDDDTNTCFYGRLEDRNSSLGISLKVHGGMHMPELLLTVEILSHDEANVVLQVTAPLDSVLSGDGSVVCPAPDSVDTADTADTAAP